MFRSQINATGLACGAYSLCRQVSVDETRDITKYHVQQMYVIHDVLIEYLQDRSNRKSSYKKITPPFHRSPVDRKTIFSITDRVKQHALYLIQSHITITRQTPVSISRRHRCATFFTKIKGWVVPPYYTFARSL